MPTQRTRVVRRRWGRGEADQGQASWDRRPENADARTADADSHPEGRRIGRGACHTHPEPEPTATPTPEPTPTSTAVPTPTPSEAVAWQGDDHLNILLLGGDSGEGRVGIRTDTMIVASIEPSTGKAALFQFPRNLVGVPLPPPLDQNWQCRCWPWLLNALYGDAPAFPGLWPGDTPGPDALKGVLGHVMGIEIDYYATVDLRSFEAIIDALGGVTMNVPETVTVRPTRGRRRVEVLRRDRRTTSLHGHRGA
ncbi:MAG: LCP family protein [Chloroflexia bacterium]